MFSYILRISEPFPCSFSHSPTCWGAIAHAPARLLRTPWLCKCLLSRISREWRKKNGCKRLSVRVAFGFGTCFYLRMFLPPSLCMAAVCMLRPYSLSSRARARMVRKNYQCIEKPVRASLLPPRFFVFVAGARLHLFPPTSAAFVKPQIAHFHSLKAAP